MRRVCILIRKHFQESFKQATFESLPRHVHSSKNVTDLTHDPGQRLPWE
jgi:hypothetical protein